MPSNKTATNKMDVAPKSPLSGFRKAGGLRNQSRAFHMAGGLSLLWLICVIAYAAGFFGLLDAAVLAPRTAAGLEIALFLLAGFAPIALFFYGALLSMKAEEIRVETARLSSAIDALRHSVAPRAMPTANDLADALTVAARTTMSEEKAALAAGLTRLDGALAETQSMMDELTQRESKARRAAKKTSGPPALANHDQPALPLGAEGEVIEEGAVDISWANVVRALDFPRNEKDEDGFAILRQVVADHDFASLLQAAEDTLSLLSEEGLFMEDLTPTPAPLAVWKRYAEGARGADVAKIGGVNDEVALALARSKIRTDPVFRDTAMHFLRRFDRLIVRMFAELGDDPMVLEVADSRTGRAFMIASRVMGVFD